MHFSLNWPLGQFSIYVVMSVAAAAKSGYLLPSFFNVLFFLFTKFKSQNGKLKKNIPLGKSYERPGP